MSRLFAPRGGRAAEGRSLSLVSNSLALIGSKLATLGFGFFFWLLAA